MAITALNKLSSIARLNEAVGKNTAEMIELAGGFITGAVLTYLAVRFFGCQKERLEQRHARINAEDTRRREEEKTAVVFRCGKKDS